MYVLHFFFEDSIFKLEKSNRNSPHLTPIGSNRTESLTCSCHYSGLAKLGKSHHEVITQVRLGM